LPAPLVGWRRAFVCSGGRSSCGGGRSLVPGAVGRVAAGVRLFRAPFVVRRRAFACSGRRSSCGGGRSLVSDAVCRVAPGSWVLAGSVVPGTSPLSVPGGARATAPRLREISATLVPCSGPSAVPDAAHPPVSAPSRFGRRRRTDRLEQPSRTALVRARTARHRSAPAIVPRHAAVLHVSTEGLHANVRSLPGPASLRPRHPSRGSRCPRRRAWAASRRVAGERRAS